MKIPLIVISLCVFGSLARADEPKLIPAMVVKIAKLIAKDKVYEAINDFDLERPTFNNEGKVWTFQFKQGMGVSFESAIPIFEIRDLDCYFRVGTLFSSGTNVQKFKMPPKFRKEISTLMKVDGDGKKGEQRADSKQPEAPQPPR